MPLKVWPVSSKRRENRPIRRLYRTSFPKKERVSFGSMVRRARKPHVDFLSFYQDNDLAGMAYLFTWEDVLYLFYLAVSPQLQNQGIGGKILDLLKDRYPERRIVLSIEPLEENAANFSQRQRRLDFYRGHGFADIGLSSTHRGMRYTTLVYGGTFTQEEWNQLWKHY